MLYFWYDRIVVPNAKVALRIIMIIIDTVTIVIIINIITSRAEPNSHKFSVHNFTFIVQDVPLDLSIVNISFTFDGTKKFQRKQLL